MRIDIITAVPKVFAGFLSQSVIGRAVDNGIAEINIIDLRDFAEGKYRQIDDAPFGGGAGMVLMPGPLSNAIESCKQQRKYNEVIFFLPEGEKMNQLFINSQSTMDNILIVCGHYKGIDQRIVDHYATAIVSIGDYVVTGGELPAALYCDALIRLLPGAIGDEQSALEDSFQDNLLSAPVYTRPAIFNDMKVPDILLSGDHKKISNWKLEEAYKKTQKLRPDILDNTPSSKKGK